jgi:hypothetical protein
MFAARAPHANAEHRASLVYEVRKHVGEHRGELAEQPGGRRLFGHEPSDLLGVALHIAEPRHPIGTLEEANVEHPVCRGRNTVPITEVKAVDTRYLAIAPVIEEAFEIRAVRPLDGRNQSVRPAGQSGRPRRWYGANGEEPVSQALHIHLANQGGATVIGYQNRKVGRSPDLLAELAEVPSDR